MPPSAVAALRELAEPLAAISLTHLSPETRQKLKDDQKLTIPLFVALLAVMALGPLIGSRALVQELFRLLCLLVLYTHRQNIGRLWRGEENRMNLAGRNAGGP